MHWRLYNLQGPSTGLFSLCLPTKVLCAFLYCLVHAIFLLTMGLATSLQEHYPHPKRKEVRAGARTHIHTNDSPINFNLKKNIKKIPCKHQLLCLKWRGSIFLSISNGKCWQEVSHILTILTFGMPSVSPSRNSISWLARWSSLAAATTSIASETAAASSGFAFITCIRCFSACSKKFCVTASWLRL